jgi:translation initiation factor IF-2
VAAEAAAKAEGRCKPVPTEGEKAAAESKARADEEAARAADLGERRRKAEAEAAAIRSMMSTPKKVLVAKKPEEPKPVAKPAEDAKSGVKGTLHKPAAGAPRPGTPAAAAPAGPGAGKEVKSAKLSSSWAGDPAKKKAIKTRGDTASGGVGRNNWRGGPRGRVAMTVTSAMSRSRPHRSKPGCWRSTCPKPSPWPNWRTRWPSRRPR